MDNSYIAREITVFEGYEKRLPADRPSELSIYTNYTEIVPLQIEKSTRDLREGTLSFHRVMRQRQMTLRKKFTRRSRGNGFQSRLER